MHACLLRSHANCVLPLVSQRRPWSKLLDSSALSKPHNIVDMNARLRSNLSEYSANYALLVVAVVSLALLSHPGSLVVVALLAAGWVSLLTRPDTPVVVSGRTVSRQEQIAAAAVVSLGAACPRNSPCAAVRCQCSHLVHLPHLLHFPQLLCCCSHRSRQFWQARSASRQRA